MAVIPKCEIIDMTSDNDDEVLEVKLEITKDDPSSRFEEPDPEQETVSIVSNRKDEIPIVVGPTVSSSPEVDIPFPNLALPRSTLYNKPVKAAHANTQARFARLAKLFASFELNEVSTLRDLVGDCWAREKEVSSNYAYRRIFLS